VRAKDHRSESFPVASLLLAKPLRAPILAFYRFVRLADDIADAPDRTPADKLARLASLETALLAADPREPAAASLACVDQAVGAGVEEAHLLLGAFRQDVVKRRYADWAELLDYCRSSANPVGRFLLRLHGEDERAHAPAEALCTALQILNHLQDLGPDRERLDRVYLPLPWLEQVGGEAAFFAPGAMAERRLLLDAVLDQTDALLATAAALPVRLRSRRLAAQAAATLACGHALSRKLRRHDPLTLRVALSRPEVALHVLRAGVQAGILRRAHGDDMLTRAIVRRSGSSFRLGIGSLKGERRRAMQALYAFCRTVDDLADGHAPAAERQRFLAAWRQELSRLATEPQSPLGRELAWACRRFDLPQDELGLLLDGLAADACERVRLPDETALDGYCRAVAGTVGLLAVRIFGAEGSDGFALHLARGLQLVNILRDVEEDAARDRVYLPLSRLAGLGIPNREAGAIVGHPSFARAWTQLADEAASVFSDVDAMLGNLDRRRLRPALLMLWSYRPLLERLRSQGWRPDRPRARLGRAAKLRLAWMALQEPA
jgi:phytoene synthase